MTVDIAYLTPARAARLRRKDAKEGMKRLLTAYTLLLFFAAFREKALIHDGDPFAIQI